jgi:hypothetical protein
MWMKEFFVNVTLNTFASLSVNSAKGLYLNVRDSSAAKNAPSE